MTSSVLASGRMLVADMSKTQQWRKMYDKKYITAQERYSVIRFVAKTNGDDIYTLYSGVHSAYIMTLPLPNSHWQLSTAPEPFFTYRIPYLAFIETKLYDLGRPICVEFLFKPFDALKKLRSFADSPLELLVSPLQPV